MAVAREPSSWAAHCSNSPNEMISIRVFMCVMFLDIGRHRKKDVRSRHYSNAYFEQKNEKDFRKEWILI